MRYALFLTKYIDCCSFAHLSLKVTGLTIGKPASINLLDHF